MTMTQKEGSRDMSRMGPPPHKFSSLHHVAKKGCLRSRLLRNGALLGCKIVDPSWGARGRVVGKWRPEWGKSIGWSSKDHT